ncbi:hypothetical protein [Sphingobacterium spiritivorum]
MHQVKGLAQKIRNEVTSKKNSVK